MAAYMRRLLRKSSTLAADAIDIGDQTADLEAVCSAGLAFGTVGYRDLASLRKSGPDQEFDSVADLRRISADV